MSLKITQLAYQHWRSGLNAMHVVLAGLGLYVLFLVIQSLRDPLRSIPDAAPSVRFTRFWYLWQLWRGDFQDTNVDLHKKHGKIVRTAPNEYSIDDLEAVRAIYGHGTKFTKGDWYLAFATPGTLSSSMFAQQDIKKHSELRRKYNNFYSLSTLVHYEDYINECVIQFTGKLEQFSKTGETINFAHWLQCYAFDVITMITFNRRFGFLENGEDIGGVIKSLDNFNLYTTLMGVFPWLHNRISMLGPAVGIGYIVGYVNQCIDDRRRASLEGEDLSTVPDFVSKFFVNNERDPKGFTTLHIFGGAATNVVAGSDTTAIALSSIFRQLSTHPQALEKLREELREAKKAGTISDPITFSESQRLKYFQAVIKEAMRLHPSAALPMWRVVPEGGAVLLGRSFPAGTVVGVNAWVAHRNKDIFGPDVEYFRPERWLVEPEHVAAMDRYFMPFGMGSRTCIGRNISMLEMSKLVPQLVQKFDFERSWDHIENLNRWFVKMKGLDVKIKSLADEKE